jgi:hypothetical protein
VDSNTEMLHSPECYTITAYGTVHDGAASDTLETEIRPACATRCVVTQGQTHQHSTLDHLDPRCTPMHGWRSAVWVSCRVPGHILQIL